MCKDVTTRGNYYPDKSMATPSVSSANIFVLERLTEPGLGATIVPPCYKHKQRRFRKSREAN